MRRFLKGNSSPDGKVNGMDNAAARETMPLMPVQLNAMMTAAGGIGSLRPIDGKSFIGTYAAGYTQMNRTARTTNEMVAP